MDNELQSLLALALTPKLGPITARKMIAYYGGAEQVFRLGEKDLKRVPGIGNTLVNKIDFEEGVRLAESEIKYCFENDIKIVSCFNEQYPLRLTHCPDCPIVLFVRGDMASMQTQRALSVVGTRNATAYGKKVVEDIIVEAKEKGVDLGVISGLAYGIDYAAHRSAVDNELPTVAALGHGLDKIYPAHHRELAQRILKEGGALVTEFPHNSYFDKRNFVRRNRIIAGLSDAVLVAESGIVGGALVTADYASGYGREVFAIPGKVGDSCSAGCNSLIKKNIAILCESFGDIEYQMGWEARVERPVQKELFVELTADEEAIMALFEDDQPITLDYIAVKLSLPVYKVSTDLLNMEFKGVLKALPGNQYRRV